MYYKLNNKHNNQHVLNHIRAHQAHHSQRKQSPQGGQSAGAVHTQLQRVEVPSYSKQRARHTTTRAPSLHKEGSELVRCTLSHSALRCHQRRTSHIEALRTQRAKAPLASNRETQGSGAHTQPRSMLGSIPGSPRASTERSAHQRAHISDAYTSAQQHSTHQIITHRAERWYQPTPSR